MLFKNDEIKTSVEEKPQKQSWILEEKMDQEATHIYERNATLNDVFPEEFLQGKIYTLFSDGQWSQYELVDYLLRYTGEGSALYFSTWAMSEFSARQLATWLDEGRISELWGVLDIRSKTRHPSSYDIARTCFDKIKTTNCHAKVTVIVPKDEAKPHLCIVGSANWTQNPRKECLVVFNSKESAARHVGWIKGIVQD